MTLEDEIVQRALCMGEFCARDVAEAPTPEEVNRALLVLGRLVASGDLTSEIRVKGGHAVVWYRWVND